MRKVAIAVLLTGGAFVAQPVSATTVLPACSASDISSTAAPTNTAFASTTCTGFYAGNLLNGSPADKTAQVNALNILLGAGTYSVATFNFGSFANISGLNGLKTIDFPGLLSGTTVIGVHYGAGTGSPSDVAGNRGGDKTDTTAFYKFDAGTSIDKFYLTYKASSNVVLYSTGGGPTYPPIPEPATWAMLIAGFGMVAITMRRRHKVAIHYA